MNTPAPAREQQPDDRARTHPDPEPPITPDLDDPLSPLIAPGGKVDPDAIRDAAAADEDDDGLRRVRFVLTRDLNKRLDLYLVDRIAFMSRSQLQALIERGGVAVNGRAPKPSTKLRLGDTVDVVVPPPAPTHIQGENIPITPIFEDEHMIVLNKSPDIIVHPARAHNKGTLLNALVHHFAHTSPTGGSLSSVGDEFARPGVVHRLDRRTSGVMVVAKSDEAHWKLGWQFEQREPDKRYLALAEGVLDADADVIDAPIGPHPSRAKGLREKMSIRRDHLGKPALTIYRVRQRFAKFTLVELELKTGRTHQIRVHMAHLGHPLAGDDMYDGHTLRASHIDPRLPDDDIILDRQALHAAMLTLTHPIHGRRMTFTAPIPADFARALTLLRAIPGASPVLDPPGSALDLGDALGDRP